MATFDARESSTYLGSAHLNLHVQELNSSAAKCQHQIARILERGFL